MRRVSQEFISDAAQDNQPFALKANVFAGADIDYFGSVLMRDGSDLTPDRDLLCQHLRERDQLGYFGSLLSLRRDQRTDVLLILLNGTAPRAQKQRLDEALDLVRSEYVRRGLGNRFRRLDSILSRNTWH